MADQWQSLIDALESMTRIQWVSCPSKINRAENKALQLQWAKDVGFAVPKTRITNSQAALSTFTAAEGDLIAKALGGGYIEGQPSRFIFTTSLTEMAAPEKEEFAASPIIIQQRLKPDAHLRITVIGSTVLSAEVVPPDGPRSVLDWRTSPTPPIVQARSIPDSIANAASALVKKAQLAFSSMDVVLAGGMYYFLDLNPNGEWGWLERGAKLPISDALLDVLTKGA